MTKPSKRKPKPATIQYLAEFKYEDETREDITEFPLTVPVSCEQFQVEEAKKILLRVLSTQKGKITHIFLWTFIREKSEDGSIKLEKKRLLMSSSIEPYKEFGKEAEAYVSPEDEEVLKLIGACFLRAISMPVI
jgi:hypothetical protein